MKHIFGIALLVLSLFSIASVSAATTCTFTTSGSTYSLDGDCTTDETLLVPNGMTLDGNGHTITAVDPDADHFRGAVVMNEGAQAHVTNVHVTADGLANVCDNDADRLRGIMFEAASGSITHTSVTGINQGASGCQEGNAIEVRNAPFDGTHPNTVEVEVAHNTVTDYQKTGIVVNGDVSADVHHNDVGSSATQANLAANSVQVGFGASATVEHNRIDGNEWYGFDPVSSNYAGSAVLLVFNGESSVSRNIVRGNSDVGLWVQTSAPVHVENNKLFDSGRDTGGYDIGVLALADDASFRNNKVRGFDTSYYGVSGGKNKAVPGPSVGEAFW